MGKCFNGIVIHKKPAGRYVIIITLILLLCINIICVFSVKSAGIGEENVVRGEKLSGQNFQMVAKKGNKELHINPADGNILVKDVSSGNEWYAYPKDRDEDKVATGFNSFNMRSAFILKYINEKRVVNDTNSFISSTNKNGLTCYKTEDGVVFNYYLPSEKITIPIKCCLNDDNSIDISVMTNEIKEDDNFKVTELTLYPYLGSASKNDNGYIILPDGSGVLVPFHSDDEIKANNVYYRKAVYGRDPMLSLRADITRTQNIYIPAFAVKCEKSAVLGIVTSGDAVTDIEMTVKGNESERMTVHPIMVYRKVDSILLHEKQWNERTVTVYSRTPPSINQYTVKYYLLGETDYSEIASVTANYYKSQSGYSDSDRTHSQVLINIFGGVKVQDTILGMPVDKLMPITTFSQAEQILRELRDSGIQGIQSVFYGAYSGGLYDKMPTKAKFDSKLGGNSGWNQLCQWAFENQIDIYPATDLLSIYKSGNSVSKTKDSSRSIHGGIANLYKFSLSTYQPEKDGMMYTILSPKAYGKIFDRFINNICKTDYPAIADVTSGRLSSDNHRDFLGKKLAFDRESAKLEYQKQIEKVIKNKIKYSSSGANAYQMIYSKCITDIPYQSSRERGFGYDIPFYQLVALNFAQVFSQPINYSYNEESAILKAIEFGMNPSYMLSWNDTNNLYNSKANWMYSGKFSQNKDTITAQLSQYKEAIDIIANSQMVRHQAIGEDFYKTEYLTGDIIYINYSAQMSEADGYKIPANGVLAVKKSAAVLNQEG